MSQLLFGINRKLICGSYCSALEEIGSYFQCDSYRWNIDIVGKYISEGEYVCFIVSAVLKEETPY